MPVPESRRLLKQIGTVSLITGLSQVAYLLANIVLGRGLTQAQFGLVTLANNVINLTAYLSLLGLNSALTRAVPQSELREMNWRGHIGRVAGLAALISAATCGLAGAIYHFTPLETGLMALASWLFGLSIAGSSLLAIERRFAASQFWPNLWRGVLLVAAGTLMLGGRIQSLPILASYVVAGLAQVGGLWLALRPLRGGPRPLPGARLLKEGMLFFGLFLTSTLMLRLDAFLLAGLVSTAALGQYSAAANIALTGYGVLSLGIAQVLMPRLASGEPLQLRRLLLLLLLAGGGAAVALTFFGSPLIQFLYANRYPADYRNLLALLCAAGLVQVIYVVPSALLGARAPVPMLRSFLLVNLVSVGINAGLNLLLIPRFGLEGAAMATLLSWVWRLAWAAGLARGVPQRPAQTPVSGSILPD